MATTDGLPGLRQSQAHAEAARATSEARAHLRELNYAAEQGADVRADIEDAKAKLESAKLAEYKALQEYIDPFKVKRQW